MAEGAAVRAGASWSNRQNFLREALKVSELQLPEQDNPAGQPFWLFQLGELEEGKVAAADLVNQQIISAHPRGR